MVSLTFDKPKHEYSISTDLIADRYILEVLFFHYCDGPNVTLFTGRPQVAL